MEIWKDYYRILQLHHLAEPEVIEGAFKRLAKKYHPDVCKDANAESTMKLINEAYETLRDPVKRREYHEEWERRNQRTAPAERENSFDEVLVKKAKSALDAYLQSIQRHDYPTAYRLISRHDKTRITETDFIQWQESVAKIFELTAFESEIHQVKHRESIHHETYQMTAEFYIAMVENNRIMDRREKGQFLRKTVLENNQWKVYLGHQDVRGYTEKFHRLANLITVKSVVQELIDTQSKIDQRTGLPNQKAFFASAESELARFKRYRNIFSVIMAELDRLKPEHDTPDVVDRIMKYVGESIIKELRVLDVVARWDDKSLAILLPETHLNGAVVVAKKIKALTETLKMGVKGGPARIAFSFGVVENDASSVENTIRQVCYYLNAAKRAGGNGIAAPKLRR
jgi:diguanylate cyclase (GGDEF)-like protein